MKALFKFGLSAAALTVAMPAWAQDFDDDDVVIVTATKREEAQVNVPLGVTALTADRLDKLGATSSGDYLRFVPAASFDQRFDFPRGGVRPNIRGVQIGENPTTAMYLNDVPLQPQQFDRIGLPDPNLYDVERVEVLKGPQGTLYGAAAMGGLIKVVTRQPVLNEFEASTSIQGYNIEDGGNGYQFDGMMNFPLVEDKLALRVVGTFAQDDGFIQEADGEFFFNEFTNFGSGSFSDLGDVVAAIEGQSPNDFLNSSNHTVLRTQLHWEISDSIRTTPMFFYQRTSFGHGAPISGEFLRESNEIFFPVVNGAAAESEISYQVFNVPVEVDIGEFTLTSSTSFNVIDYERDNPAGGINGSFDIDIFDVDRPIVGDDGDETQFVQEIRLDGSLSDIIPGLSGDFVVGGFYRDLEAGTIQVLANPGFNTPSSGTSNLFTRPQEDNTYEELAGFFDLSIDLGNHFRVGGGLRVYEYDRRIATTTNGAFVNGGASESVTDIELSESGVNFSASAAFYPWGIDSNRGSVYFRAADGFRPGFGRPVDNLPSTCDAEVGNNTGFAEQDNARNYEIGAKYAANGFSFSGAVFQIDWTDLQVDKQLQCFSATFPANVGEAQIRGFEAEVSGGFGPVDVFAGVGYVDAELEQDAINLGGVEGDPLPLVAPWTANASIQYTPDYLSEFGGYFLVDYSFQDSSNYGFASTSREREELGLLGARIGGTVEDWTVEVFARNLTNERVLGQCTDSGLPIAGERVDCTNNPRTIGIRLARDFN